jgi:hypothetical protein
MRETMQDDRQRGRMEDRMEDRTEDRIDFSALDPSHNELRWTRTVHALVGSALVERRKRLSIEQQLLRWARPVLAVAAGLSFVTWTASYLASNRAQQVSTLQNPPALILANWAANNQIPEPSDLFGTLGGN